MNPTLVVYNGSVMFIRLWALQLQLLAYVVWSSKILINWYY